MNVFLDLDGVLANFVKGMCLAHGKPDPYQDRSNLGKWNMAEIWGMSEPEFWAVADAIFWESLDPLEDATDIWKLAESKGSVYIATSPSNNWGCPSGKREWVSEHFPSLFSKTIICSNKSLFAKDDAILIDDSDSNVEKFRRAGGQAVLVPRPWNSLHGRNAVEEVRSALDSF